MITLIVDGDDHAPKKASNKSIFLSISLNMPRSLSKTVMMVVVCSGKGDC